MHIHPITPRVQSALNCVAESRDDHKGNILADNAMPIYCR